MTLAARCVDVRNVDAKTTFMIDERVAIRTPALPSSIARSLYAATDPCAAAMNLVSRRGTEYHTIRVATPDLADGIDKWLDAGERRKSSVPINVLNYLVRSSTRCTPLAMCSTVSLCTRGETDVFPSIVDDLVTVTRIDSGWLFDQVRALELDREVVADIELRPSGSYRTIAGRLEVSDSARTEVAGSSSSPVPTSLLVTPALAFVLAQSYPATGRGLAGSLVDSFGVGYDDAIAFVAKLVELGVFVSELRGNLLDDHLERVVASLERHGGSRGKRIARLSAELRAVDAMTISNRTEALGRIRRDFTEDDFVAPALYQVDSTREVVGSLPNAYLERVRDGFDALVVRATPSDANPRLARAFAARYNEGREIPLLEVLEIPEIVASTAYRLDRRDVPDPYDVRVCAEFAEAIANGKAVVDLDETPVNDPPSASRLAIAYETITVPLRVGGATVPGLWNGFFESYGKSVARFAHIVGDGSSRRARDGGAAHGASHAEFSFVPHAKRSANVSIRPNVFDVELLFGLYPDERTARSLTLADLVVGVQEGRAYLRSLDRPERLVAHQSHMLNIAASPAARLIAAIASSDYSRIGFRCPSDLRTLPYRPRTTLARCVVAPATWIVPARVARDFATDAGARFRDTWRMPHRIYLVEGDNRLFLDLDHPTSVAQIVTAGNRAELEGFVEIHECLPDFDDTVIEGGRGAYFAEISAVLYRGAPNEKRVDVPDSPARAVRLRPPGSEWVYVKAYLPADRSTAFIETVVAPLIAASTDCDLVHFLRYADPDEHIRLRLRAPAGGDDQALLMRLIRLSKTWVESGRATRTEFATYDREIERYGGLAAIDAAETVFFRDTVSVLSDLPTMRDLAKRRHRYVARAAQFLATLCGGEAEAVAWYARVHGRRPHLDADAWLDVRKSIATFVASPSDDRLASAAGILRDAVSNDGRDHVFRALLHMHFNRIGLRAPLESLAASMVVATIDGALHSAPGRHTNRLLTATS